MAKKKRKGRKGKRKLTAKQIAAGFGGKAAQARAHHGGKRKKRRKSKHARAEMNPRRKRKNPRYKYEGEIPYMTGSGPKVWKAKGYSKKFRSAGEIATEERQRAIAEDLINQLVDDHLIVPKEKREFLQQIGMTSGDVGAMKSLVKDMKKLHSKLVADAKAADKAHAEASLIDKLGGKAVLENPRKKKKKKKAKRSKKRSKKRSRKAKSAKRAKPRKTKRRKSRKGKARKSSGSLSLYSRRAKKRVRINVKVNPDFSQMTETLKALAVPAAYAAVGLVAINAVILPLADKFLGSKLPGGSIAGAIASKLPASMAGVAPYVAPALSIGAALGIGYLAHSKMRGKAGDMIARGAVGAAGLATAMLAVTLVTKYALPPVQKAAGLSGMSGVKYFPNGMSGADFGMYPQMGQYHQQPGDFGIIPEGLRGVKYFPKKSGMGAVEFFPDGADGDEMYHQSEAGDLMEAEGLGIIPEGLAGADFGEIPQGMGEDGQMG